jgi:hypothetical protein
MPDASGASAILYTNNRMKSPEDRARVICGLVTMVETGKFDSREPRDLGLALDLAPFLIDTTGD